MWLSLRARLLGLLLPVVLSTAFATTVHAQDEEPFRDPFPASRWCEDSATACWWDPDEHEWFNGIRIIADFDVRFLFQGGRNRFVQSGFLSLSKLAVEVNVYRSWAALQFAIHGPGAIQMDTFSAVRPLLKNRDGVVSSDLGWSVGLSFLDSSLALLWGRMEYDRRYFKDLCPESEVQREIDRRKAGAEARCVLSTDTRDSYWYLTFQPISAIRSGIKQGEEQAEDDTNEPETPSAGVIPFQRPPSRP